MSQIIQSRTRKQIRESIGRNAGIMKLGEATSNGDTASLIDSYTFAKYADDEIIGRQILFVSGTAGNVGQKTFVSDYAATGTDATLAPVVPSSTADGDGFEMWDENCFSEDVDDMINQAISEVSAECVQEKETHNVFTDDELYEYDCLSSYVALHKVEYEYLIDKEVDIDLCDVVWDNADSDVTLSVDTDLKKEGSGCLKAVVAAGAGAGDILCTNTLTAKNLSECDQIEVWIRSTVALAAGDLQVLLDNTAACASPLESLDIPATSADVWTRHIISLATPSLDSAIISVGIKMVTDKGAFTLYVDYIKAVKSTSRLYKELNPQMWSIVRASTPLLKLSQSAINLIGDNKLLRLNGYQLPALLSADATTSEIDPDYLIAKVTGMLLMSEAVTSRMDTKGRQERARFWLDQAEKRKRYIGTAIASDTRIV